MRRSRGSSRGTPPDIIADASPLIALGQIGAFDLLRALLPSVVIPPAVRREIVSVALPARIQERRLGRPTDARVVAARLGPGEREAISLALETSVGRIILDDEAARLLAARLALEVVGTLGIILPAKQRHVVPAVRPYFDALRSVNFFIGDCLYDHLLTIAGER